MVSPILPSTVALYPGAFPQVNNTGTGFVFSSQQSAYAKLTFPYTAFQTASTTNTITAFTLPSASVLNNVFIKHSVAFAGTSITAVTASVGIASNHTQLIAGVDVFQSVADAAWDAVQANYLASWANATLMKITLVSTGANLSALSAGSVDVFYNWTSI